MRRRAFLATVAVAGSAGVAGCDVRPPDGTTPTEDPRRTVRVGPGGPDCPGDSWGQMAAISESYEAAVVDAADAEALLAADEDRGGGEFVHVTPRPDGVEWKDRTVYVAGRYDADDWFLFTTRGGTDLVGALVVALADGSTEVVWFYVGAC